MKSNLSLRAVHMDLTSDQVLEASTNSTYPHIGDLCRDNILLDRPKS